MNRETSSRPDLPAELGKSALRIIAALTVILGVPALCYLCWQPGSEARVAATVPLTRRLAQSFPFPACRPIDTKPQENKSLCCRSHKSHCPPFGSAAA